MSDRSRQFRRVSTNLQDTAKQVVDLDAWDKAHSYLPGTAYVVDGKSAYHGKHIPHLDRAVSDMEAGDYDVLVFWAADRMWRGESLAKALAYVERIHATGGRVEFVKDSHLNVASDNSMPAWVRNMLFAQAFGVANAESERKSQRTHMDIESKRATGAAHGRAPWGYEIQGPKDGKRFVPTEIGREWVPVIFDMAVNRKSGRAIAAYLTAQNVPTVKGGIWNETYVVRLIGNPIYMGQRRGGGTLETEALVSATTWQAANAASRNRAKPGRATTVNEKALLAPVCDVCYGQEREGCADGISPMYRTYVGSNGNRTAYYRCWGHGPQRKGCGAPMIPCNELDKQALAMLAHDPRPHTEYTFVPGDDVEDQIVKLREAGAAAMRQGDMEAVADAVAQIKELESPSRKRKLARWEPTETDITRGDYFASLDPAAQREYISHWHPRVSCATDGKVWISVDEFAAEHIAL